ncbi:MAG: hypothetical protein JO071_01325 [Deltaproteobacteria bacterium]|nr:hypothetical protein [Deltaproteobacteria bacterium]
MSSKKAGPGHDALTAWPEVRLVVINPLREVSTPPHGGAPGNRQAGKIIGFYPF